MAFTDDEKKELVEIQKTAFLEGLKQYDSERAEWEANVAAQNGNGSKGNDNGGTGNDNQPAPSLAERLLGGSKRSKS